jgi:hypothetical protein
MFSSYKQSAARPHPPTRVPSLCGSQLILFVSSVHHPPSSSPGLYPDCAICRHPGMEPRPGRLLASLTTLTCSPQQSLQGYLLDAASFPEHTDRCRHILTPSSVTALKIQGQAARGGSAQPRGLGSWQAHTRLNGERVACGRSGARPGDADSHEFKPLTWLAEAQRKHGSGQADAEPEEGANTRRDGSRGLSATTTRSHVQAGLRCGGREPISRPSVAAQSSRPAKA